jgi:hypothetical protein
VTDCCTKEQTVVSWFRSFDNKYKSANRLGGGCGATIRAIKERFFLIKNKHTLKVDQ